LILDELRLRGVVRSTNNPLSDLAEELFCQTFGWTRAERSNAGHDATDAANVLYQIKGRRLSPLNASRQLSAIRDLEAKPFHYLAGLLVDEQFKILRAAIVPWEVVHAKSRFVARTNSWRFLLRDDVWSEPGVRDVTEELRKTAAALYAIRSH
jgi:hypothetical protein